MKNTLQQIWIKSIRNSLDAWFPILGLLLLSAYWWSVHPAGFSLQYIEDLCGDFLRQTMAENLEIYGKPVFRSDSFMAPYGLSIPYMSWSIERDWFGAYFWKWSNDFPFFWFYYGVSLFVSYLGVGWILRKMHLSRSAAWGLATAAVLFHIPRHFKTWHHFEHLPEHWIYLSLFLDAWIWQRFWRERRWSLHHEAWRGLMILGVMMTTGYFWGPMVMEWLFVRMSLLGVFLYRKRSREKNQDLKTGSLLVEWNFRKILPPVVLGLCILILELRWFLSLYEEVKVTGKVLNNTGWFAFFHLPFRPLWWDLLAKPETPFYFLSETLTTLGWVWLIPFFISLWVLRKKSKGPGLGVILPFLIFVTLAYVWECRVISLSMVNALREVFPFMEFFRVATRWSLFLPAALGVIVALAWPELSSWFQNRFATRKWAPIALALFLISSTAEMSWLLHPVNMLPPMPDPLKGLLTDIKGSPGTTVLDLPFCVTGGNGVCGAQQCPNYPGSTVGQCLRMWHQKKIYGLYQARSNEATCQVYQRSPYLSWFAAWQQRRCFNDQEWNDFCGYLDQHPETTAVLFYPDVWTGANTPECISQFDAHLGPRVSTAEMPASPSFGGKWTTTSRVFRYPGQCLEKRPETSGQTEKTQATH